MAKYTYGQLEGLWISAGGNAAMAPIMAAIAMAESSGNSLATNPNDNNGRQTSWGLWQISNGTHNQPVPNILDPNVNAQQAVKKYKSQGLKAWGTYTSGAYRKFLQGSVTPVTVGSTSTAQDTGLSIPGTGDIGNAIGEGFAKGLESLIAPVLNFLFWTVEIGIGGTLMVLGAFAMVSSSSGARNVGLSAAELVEPEAAPAIEQAKKTTPPKPVSTKQVKQSDEVRVAKSKEEFRQLRMSGYQGKIRHEYE